MTAKEEALELVNKFKIKVTVVYSEDSVPCVLNAPMIIKSSKQCALICVDEMLKPIFIGGKRYDRVLQEILFLQEVKEEIKKL